MQTRDENINRNIEVDDWIESTIQVRKRNIEKHYEVCFRCPHCQKLYKTDSDVFNGHDDSNGNSHTNNGSNNGSNNSAEFDCSSCERTFLLKNTQDSFGLFMTNEQQKRSFLTCPKCSSLKPQKSDECPICGVFASKYIEAQKAESPLLFELNQQWQKVLLNFDQDQFHQDFINKCHVKLALNLAFQKYSDLQKTIGFDSLCKKYISQIELRMVQQFKNKESSKAAETTNPLLQISLTQYISMCVGSIGLLLLLYNKFFPTFPNFNGLVTVFTVLAFGIGLFSNGKTGSADN